jgi:hypothetical protein
MSMNKTKKIWVIIGIIAIILVFTNPTNSDLDSFLTAKQFENNSGGRIAYFGIFSIYKTNIGSEYKYPNRTYLGIFKNFICVHKED